MGYRPLWESKGQADELAYFRGALFRGSPPNPTHTLCKKLRLRANSSSSLVRMAPPTLSTANLLAAEKMRKYRSTSFLEARE